MMAFADPLNQFFVIDASIAMNCDIIEQLSCLSTISAAIVHNYGQIGVLKLQTVSEFSANEKEIRQISQFVKRKIEQQPIDPMGGFNFKKTERSKSSVQKRSKVNLSFVAPESPGITSSNDFHRLSKPDISGLVRTFQDVKTKQKFHQCTFCNYQSPHSSTMKRHVELKHLPQTISYNCLQCSSTFRQKSNLKIHYKGVHGLLDPAAKAMMP